jgi:hypothetical protein
MGGVRPYQPAQPARSHARGTKNDYQTLFSRPSIPVGPPQDRVHRLVVDLEIGFLNDGQSVRLSAAGWVILGPGTYPPDRNSIAFAAPPRPVAGPELAPPRRGFREDLTVQAIAVPATRAESELTQITIERHGVTSTLGFQQITPATRTQPCAPKPK